MQRTLSPSYSRKGVKASLSLVNEFTGADVSLDKAAGGFRGGGGGAGVGGEGVQKVLQPKRKASRALREGGRETWHQDSPEHWALETANKGRSAPLLLLLLLTTTTASADVQHKPIINTARPQLQ